MVAPTTPPPPPLAEAVFAEGDCPRFVLGPAGWVGLEWAAGEMDLVLPGDRSPALDTSGRVLCRHAIVAPGWWLQAVEARDRYPLLVEQLRLWGAYAEAQAAWQQAEQERLAELVVLARRRQLEWFAVGVVAGGVVAAGVVVTAAVAAPR